MLWVNELDGSVLASAFKCAFWASEPTSTIVVPADRVQVSGLRERQSLGKKKWRLTSSIRPRHCKAGLSRMFTWAQMQALRPS